MPQARTTSTITRNQYGVEVENRAVPTSARATSVSPDAATRSAPKRTTSLGVFGATIIIVAEMGSRRSAASSGL